MANQTINPNYFPVNKVQVTSQFTLHPGDFVNTFTPPHHITRNHKSYGWISGSNILSGKQ